MANLYPNLRFSRRRDHEYKPTLTKFCWNKPWHKKHTWSFLSLIGNMAAEKPKKSCFCLPCKNVPTPGNPKEWMGTCRHFFMKSTSSGCRKESSSVYLLWYMVAFMAPRRLTSPKQFNCPSESRRLRSGPVHFTPLRRPHWSSRSRDDPPSATARFQQL